MKKTLLLLVALITATIAFASVEIDGIYYNLNNSNQTAEVTYQYYHSGNNYSGVTSISIPEKVTYNSTEYSVTSIGSSAFSYCSSLTSVTIPNSVTSIGSSAFSYCSSLTSITIGNSVTSIGESAFNYCDNITEIHISDIAKWCDIDFHNSSSNPLSENAYLYLNGNKITVLVIPEGVDSIKNYAFYSCDQLTSITIPNSVTSIGDDAFSWCKSLTSITIPNSVTSIGSFAFNYCSSLTSITIGNSVTSIGNDAFSNCLSLTSIEVNANNQNYASIDGVLYNKEITTLICCPRGKTSITIPNSVTSIGSFAFYDCDALTSITIGNSVTSIGDGAFYNCSRLTSITIGNSVTSIGSSTFSYCSSLTSITIPNSVTSIGVSAIEDGAFTGCSSLTSITMESTTPPTLDGSLGYSGMIYIPDNTLSAYKEAWGTDYIFVNNENTLTIHVETPGTLSDKIFDVGQRPTFVTKLTVTGTLNDDDFTCMRETMTSLVDVDLSGITNTTGVKFNGKSNLIKISLPENLTSIEYEAFNSCSSLTSITIPNSVTSIGSSAFSWCKSLTSITIPNSVTSIGISAFYSCDALKSITIPNSVTSIGISAFYACDALKSITIPNSITSIESSVFYSCTRLTSITIPNSVTSIGEHAFRWCESLTSITCLGSTPPEASDLGANTSTCTLIVPKVAYSSYLRHAYWGQFLNIETIDVDYKKLTAIANNAEWGVVEGGGYYDNGDAATLTATANDGYRFVKWSDEVTDTPRTVVVTQDSTFTAIFEPNTFTITTAVNDEDMGSVTEGGEYAYGTEITLSATANEGYRFAQWSDGNTDNPRIVTVTENKTYTAEFELNTYTLIAHSYSPNMGGVKITLTAEPIKGFEFVGWSDGNIENPRTIVLTEDTKLYAYFKIAQGGNPVNLETSKISSANIYTTNGTLHIEDATTDYHILDAAGRLIYSGNASTLTLPRGIYLVTINGEVEKIVL